MAEEEAGLSYTIRFIPDTTAIDQSIKEISTRVTKEIKDSVEKGKKAAGISGPATPSEPSGGIMDNIFSEFRSLKERISSTLKEINILGGRSRSLGHPSSATVGSVTELAAQKMGVGDASKLSTDQVLQILSGAVVGGGRALSAKERMPGLTTDEAVERSMQDQIGSLKGVAEELMGLKEFKSMKGLATMTRLSDFYERSTSATGKGRTKEIEQGLMESFGHDMMQDVMKAMMKREMPDAEWEATQMSFRELGKSLGLSEDDAKALTYANQEVADVVRKVGNILQVGEAKTVGESSTGVPKFARDIYNLQDLFERVNVARAETGEPPLDLRVVAKMYAGASRGTPERSVEDMKTGSAIESVEYEEIGDIVKGVVIRSFQNELPDVQRELETLLVDMTPGPAREHVKHLLTLIEEGLQVLQARSLPDFWVKIGVDRWIRDSAIAYVGALKDEITPRLYDATKERVFSELVTDTPESTTVAPVSDSQRILGKLDIMDTKLDEIKSDLPRGSGTPYGGMLGTMKSRSDSD